MVNPVKEVLAQDEDPAPPPPSCTYNPIPVQLNDREGGGPFCPLPLLPGNVSQLVDGASCDGGDNIHCHFPWNYNTGGSGRPPFNVPNDSRWDGGQCSPVMNAAGVQTGWNCQTTIRVYPIYYFPWLAPIWNNTTYSDTGDSIAITNSNAGQPDEQKTGRPGLFNFFMPKATDPTVHPRGKNLPSEDAAPGQEIRQRFFGAEDCQKNFVKDIALKPIALQNLLGIVVGCATN